MNKKTDKKSYVHIALVLDASGSMAHLRTSTLDSLKKFFKGFKSEEDKTQLDVWQFNERVRHLTSDADLNQGAPQTLEQYEPNGGTALYDAICIGIDEMGRKLAAMPEEERPDGVIFAILTDGFENASVDFTVKDVKERIAHQSEKYGWNFLFLAANQDAVTAGKGLGVEARFCSQFEATEAGMTNCFADSHVFACCREMRSSARKR